MAGSEVVVLGGGFGGAAAALAARRLLPTEHRVTLIDRSPVAHLCGANPLIVVDQRPASGVSRSTEVFAAKGIEVMFAEITAIDVEAREVATDRGGRRFDHLVVALGAVYDPEAVPGSADAHSFYHHDGALRLRERLAGLEAGTIAVVVARAPIKCPPAPIETILLIEDWARRRGIRHLVGLHLAIPEPVPLGVAGPEASGRISGMLGDRGIALHTGAVLAEVGDHGTEARFADGSSITADVLAVVPVHRVPAVVEASGLTGGKPWVPVEASTLETAVPGVFAIGDVNGIPIGPNTGVPKAGAFASGEGATVGAVIASRILGSEPPPRYDGHGSCFLAVSAAESATVGGTFLAPDGPEVGMGPVTTETMAAMVRWEQDWQAFDI
ncbi:FAD/NAD(P)-binding oxidoreductase [soil metagenome]